MEQRINASKGGDQGGVERFLGMLSDLGDAMRTAGSAEMRRIRYKDGTMDVDMSIKNVQILEQFKQKLISDAGLKVEILSANVSGDKTEARMQVKE
jgi:type II secretory pathway component PulL